jgi:catechol 2,3-dioxygenase-like lactoylglutathione lyase family enzyme
MRLGFVTLYVPDMAATVEFNEHAFGLSRRFVHESGRYAEMETGATALAFAGGGPSCPRHATPSGAVVSIRNQPAPKSHSWPMM